MSYSEIVEMVGGWGWKLHYVRAVKHVEETGVTFVTLDDGVTHNANCLSTAHVGELWAINHEPCSTHAKGQIRSAVFIEEAKN